jgi:hypothetical protein
MAHLIHAHVLLLFAAVPAAATPLKVLQAYPQPAGVYHLILENTGDKPVALAELSLTRPETEVPLHTWWIKAASETLEPGARTHVGFALKRARVPLETAALRIGGDGADAVTVPFEPQNLSAMVTTVLHDVDESHFLFAVSNRTENPITLTAIKLAGEDLRTEDGSIASLQPETTGLWMGAAAEADNLPEDGLPALAELHGDFGTIHQMVRVYSTSDFHIRGEFEAPEPFRCPSHRHGPWDRVMPALEEFETQHPDHMPRIHFCRNRLPTTLTAFAQATPLSVLNLQGSNPARGTDAPWGGFLETARSARDATLPGAMTVLVENATLYKGTFGQLAEDPSEPVPPRELRAVCYLALAHGSRGLMFRDQGGDHAWRPGITAELTALVPVLRQAVPVNNWDLEVPNGVKGWLLQNARDALILILHRGDFDKPANDVAVSLRAGPWRRYLEVGGARQQGTLSLDADQISFQIPQLDGIGVFLLTPEAPSAK